MRYPLLLLVFGLFILNCDPVSQEGKILLEKDRVWQDLRYYSLYIDRIPTREAAQKMLSPELVALQIYDTLRYLDSDTLIFFTYYDSFWENIAAGIYPIQITSGNDLRNFDTTVYIQRLTNNILYVNIPHFTSTCHQEIYNYRTIASNYDKMILDLRWNPGGYVSTCTSIVNMMLPENTNYMKVQYRDETISKDLSLPMQIDTAIWFSRGSYTDGWQNKKIVLLINEYSASASEILAETLRSDSLDCRLMGNRSFGKGIGQIHSLYNVTSGGGLSITTLKFFRMDGTTYHNEGIVPDDFLSKDPASNDNNQVIAAAQYLDPLFNALSYVEELNLIENAVIRRHNPYHRFFKNRGWPINYRPRAIAGVIYESEE